jgi:hypothetical protein
MATVEFRSAGRILRLQDKARLKTFIESIFKKEKQTAVFHHVYFLFGRVSPADEP